MYANDFYDIQNALNSNPNLLNLMIDLINKGNIIGKSTENGTRVNDLKDILIKLSNNLITLDQAYIETLSKLNPSNSIHRNNSRVFPEGWNEKLVRTQFSRFYNQAVLKEIIDNGQKLCFIPHSSHESNTSPCTINLANTQYSAQILYDRLLNAYENGVYNRNVILIPNHPHCTHVVQPLNCSAI